MNKRIIVALDGFNTAKEVYVFIEKLGKLVGRYKVGLEAFIKFGMPLVNFITVVYQKKVFLDLKMEDIPETIKLTVMELADKVEFITLRGGYDVINAARQGLLDAGTAYPNLLWVPILSSQDGEFILPPIMKDAPFDGIVTSGSRILQFRNLFPAELIVSPGIRMEADTTDDHSFSTTPEQAVKWGADYLVIGRPITKAPDPVRRVQEIIERLTDI